MKSFMRLALLASLIQAPVVQAASFDCAKAGTIVEKLICSQPNLSKLDDELDRAYKQALQRDDVKQQVILSQRQWLKQERNVCRSAECLDAAYALRIRELGISASFGIALMRPAETGAPPQPSASQNDRVRINGLDVALPAASADGARSQPAGPAAVTPMSPTSSNHPAAAPDTTLSIKGLAACRAVVEAYNERKSLGLVLPMRGERLKVDINNDGRPDFVEIEVGGIVAPGELSVFDDKGELIEITGEEETDWGEGELRWSEGVQPLRVEGVTYVLGRSGDRLNYLARIDPDNTKRLICQFGQRSTPVKVLQMSSNDRLCRAVRDNDPDLLHFPSFDQGHKLTSNALDLHRDPEPGAAIIDIDNDGQNDLVVKIAFLILRNGGCGAFYLGVLDKTLDGLDAAKTDLLPGPSGCRGESQSVFLFEGRSYIQIEGSSGVQSVVTLRNGKLQPVCELDVRTVSYVLGEYERIVKNAKESHRDPWLYALDMPGAAGLEVLIASGRSTDVQRNPPAPPLGTVVHEVLYRERYDALKFLLTHGVSPDSRTKSPSPVEVPPLILAIRGNSMEAVRLLLEHGADPNQSWASMTAKEWVKASARPEKEKAEILKLLSRR